MVRGASWARAVNVTAAFSPSLPLGAVRIKSSEFSAVNHADGSGDTAEFSPCLRALRLSAFSLCSVRGNGLRVRRPVRVRKVQLRHPLKLNTHMMARSMANMRRGICHGV